MENKEVVIKQANIPAMNPASLLEIAVSQNADVDKLEKLMDLQERFEKNQAKKEYNAAMVSAQSEMPIVPEDQANNQTRSTYSSYENVLRYTRPVYSKHGFSISFYEGDTTKEGNVRICADVMHSGGHTEKKHVDVPLDNKGIKGSVNKTNTHAKGSSISYGRGYLIRMVFNISTGDDDDGNNAGGNYTPVITEKQVADIEALIEEVGDKTERVLKWLKLEKLEDIPADWYSKVVKTLEGKRNA